MKTKRALVGAALLAVALLVLSVLAIPTRDATPALADPEACASSPADVFNWQRTETNYTSPPYPPPGLDPISLSEIDYIEFTISGATDDTAIWLDDLTMVEGEGEITEGNADEWAETGFLPNDDTQVVQEGLSSIRFDWTGAGYAELRYPATQDANWDLSGKPALSFWFKAKTVSDVPGEDEDDKYGDIKIGGVHLHRMDYAPPYYAYSLDRGQFSPNTWHYVTIPLADVYPCFSATPQNWRTTDQPPYQTTFEFSSVGSDTIASFELDADRDGDVDWEEDQVDPGQYPYSYQHTYEGQGLYEAKLEAMDSQGHVWVKYLTIAAGVEERPIRPKVMNVFCGGDSNGERMERAESLREMILQTSGGFVQIDFLEPMLPAWCFNEPVDTITGNNLDDMVKNGQVDEVWFQGQINVGEGVSFGPGAFNIHHAVFPNTDSGRAFAGRQVAGLPRHNLGHNSEYTISRAFDEGPWGQEDGGPWSDFARQAISNDPGSPFYNPGVPGVGVTHRGCNASQPFTIPNYQYSDYTYVECTAALWDDYPYNYPYAAPAQPAINCTAWGCNEEGYQPWWFDHLPTAPGTLVGEQNNWWKYILDFNSYPELMGGAALPAAHITSPVADAASHEYAVQADPATGEATVSFAGHGHDPDSTIGTDRVAKLIWDFGDGSPVEEQTINVTAEDPDTGPEHTYAQPGTYEVRLIAEDEVGRQTSPILGEARLTVHVADPDLTFVPPIPGKSPLVYGDTRAWPGETITHRVMVKNDGAVDSPDTTTLNVYLSDDDEIDAGDTVLDAQCGGQDCTVDALGSGEEQLLEYTAEIPQALDPYDPHRYRYVLVEVDPEDGIREEDESNNTALHQPWVGMSLLIYDANGDGWVAPTDYWAILAAFNSTPSALHWNPDADLTGDGAVSGLDIWAYVLHYGDSADEVDIHSAATPASGPAPLDVVINYQAHYYEGTVTKVEIDYGDGGGYVQVASGSETVFTGSEEHTYSQDAQIRLRVTWERNSQVIVTEEDGPAIDVQ